MKGAAERPLGQSVKGLSFCRDISENVSVHAEFQWFAAVIFSADAHHFRK